MPVKKPYTVIRSIPFNENWAYLIKLMENPPFRSIRGEVNRLLAHLFDLRTRPRHSSKWTFRHVVTVDEKGESTAVSIPKYLNIKESELHKNQYIEYFIHENIYIEHRTTFIRWGKQWASYRVIHGDKKVILGGIGIEPSFDVNN